MSSNSIARGTLYLGAQQVVAVIPMIMLHVGTSRLLGPRLYGFLSVIQAILAILIFTVLMGIPHTISKFTAEDTRFAACLMKQGLFMQSGIAFILAAILYFSAEILSELLNNPHLVPLLRIGAFALPLTGLAFVFINTLNGIQAFRKQAIALGSLNIFKVTGILLFIVLGFGVEGAVWGIVLSSAATLLVSALLCKGIMGSMSPDLRRISLFSVQLIITYIIVEIAEYIDLLMLQSLGSKPEDVGLFNAADALTGSLESIFIPLLIVLFPAISQKVTAKETSTLAVYMRKSLYYAFIIVTPLVFGSYFIAREILTVFYGAQYLDAAFAITPFVIATLFFITYELLDTFIRGSGNVLLSLSLAGGIFIAHVTFNAILIPRYEIYGAVATNLITAVLSSLAAGIYVMRKLRLRIRWYLSGKIFFFSFVAFSPFLLWKPGNEVSCLLMAFVCLGIYGGLLIAGKVISHSELVKIRTLCKSVFKKRTAQT